MSHPSQPKAAVQCKSGLIVFCEKNLRYEGGLKAWLFLGPYLIGALLLDWIVSSNPVAVWPGNGLWIGLLAYLVLFPAIWRRILKSFSRPKAEAAERV